MFHGLPAGQEDPIIALMLAFRGDTRPGKVDLGVGIYRDSEGATPVMSAVRKAEQHLAETQETKAYTALTGDPAFADALRKLTLGDAASADRIAFAGTPGGSGALRQAYELIARTAPDATVWLPDPSWPNHMAVLDYLQRPTRTYRYAAPEGELDRDAFFEDLASIPRGDVVLLHGCCHNPTGIDPAPEDWTRIAEILSQTGAVPLIDLAYQGFGTGLTEDAAGLRHLAKTLPEMLLCISCSKTFGLYRDRAGLLLALAANDADRTTLQSQLTLLNRNAFSFPPDHAGRLVSTVLADPVLKAEWEAELTAMRTRIRTLRDTFTAELRRLTNSDRFDRIASQNGMFSRLPLEPEAIRALREDHGIYLIGDGRMNVSGLTDETIPRVARAIAETTV
ncbi:aromatic amino acid transaminase [Aestuariibius insulae]|uniref:amino acid aminotransferase n=1 Tax=Aestuariibius insulae TaxID=2058287 RepID=UPI00345ED1A8